jgi:hypothetical protein
VALDAPQVPAAVARDGQLVAASAVRLEDVVRLPNDDRTARPSQAAAPRASPWGNPPQAVVAAAECLQDRFPIRVNISHDNDSGQVNQQRAVSSGEYAKASEFLTSGLKATPSLVWRHRRQNAAGFRLAMQDGGDRTRSFVAGKETWCRGGRSRTRNWMTST